jgi:hypothetical protein
MTNTASGSNRAPNPHDPRTAEDWLARAEMMEDRARAVGKGLIATESYERSAAWAREQAKKCKS